MDTVAFPKPEKQEKSRKPLQARTPLKRTRMKRTSSNSIKVAKKRANNAFSRYIRTRDALETTGDTLQLACFTCLKVYPAFGLACAQAGHFIPGRHSAVLYDERNAHGQCYNCNVNLKGNWRKYEDHMLEKYGQDVVDELKLMDTIEVHLKVQDYQMIEQEYIIKLRDLRMEGKLLL